MQKALKRRVPLSLAPVTCIYPSSGCTQPPIQRKFLLFPLFFLIPSLPNPFGGPNSADQTLNLGMCLCNPSLAHARREKLRPQGEGRKHSWGRRRKFGHWFCINPWRCLPAWCLGGFQWRTAQPPPCRTLPGAGDSVSSQLEMWGQRWTHE